MTSARDLEFNHATVCSFYLYMIYKFSIRFETISSTFYLACINHTLLSSRTIVLDFPYRGALLKIKRKYKVAMYKFCVFRSLYFEIHYILLRVQTIDNIFMYIMRKCSFSFLQNNYNLFLFSIFTFKYLLQQVYAVFLIFHLM